MSPFSSLRSIARALLVLATTARLTPTVGSPQDHVVASLLDSTLWTVMTYSICMTPKTPQYRPFDCGIAAFEVGAVAVVSIPTYHWGTDEWDIIRDHLGGWLPFSQARGPTEQ